MDKIDKNGTDERALYASETNVCCMENVMKWNKYGNIWIFMDAEKYIMHNYRFCTYGTCVWGVITYLGQLFLFVYSFNCIIGTMWYGWDVGYARTYRSDFEYLYNCIEF